MEQEQLHGYHDPSRPELSGKAINELNHIAAHDLAKRTIPGSFFILIVLALNANATSIFNDAALVSYTVFTIMFISVVSRFFILRALPHQNYQLKSWKLIAMISILLSSVALGLFVAANIYLYGATTITMLIVIFTAAVTSSSVITMFIWKNLATTYLVVVLAPMLASTLFSLDVNNIAIVTATGIYFIFLYIQIVRANKEYWTNLYNTKTLEKQSEDLRIAKEQAEYANKAKSEFLSNMSHELRTPLNAVLGFSQLLASDPAEPPSPSQKESLDYIKDAGNHLLSLINQVLDLAKIESGQVDLKITSLPINKIIQECTPIIETLANQNGITLMLSDDVPYLVKADKMHLKQVLINLLNNGVKYNKPNGQLSLHCESQADKIKISITDTGIGIPSQEQHKVFSSFSRLGQENSGIEGAGVGLTISKSLIEAMDGQLDFSSVEGQGSTFWIELPAA